MLRQDCKSICKEGDTSNKKIKNKNGQKQKIHETNRDTMENKDHKK